MQPWKYLKIVYHVVKFGFNLLLVIDYGGFLVFIRCWYKQVSILCDPDWFVGRYNFIVFHCAVTFAVTIQLLFLYEVINIFKSNNYKYNCTHTPVTTTNITVHIQTFVPANYNLISYPPFYHNLIRTISIVNNAGEYNDTIPYHLWHYYHF